MSRLSNIDQAIADRLALQWSRYDLGRLLNVSSHAVLKWENGKTAYPPDVRAWLRAMVRFLRDHPPPDRTYVPGVSNHPENEVA